jgi:hypothetical protein
MSIQSLVSFRFTPSMTVPAVLTLRLLGFAGGIWGAIVGAVAVSQVAWTFQQQLIAVASGLGIMFAFILTAFYAKRQHPQQVTEQKLKLLTAKKTPSHAEDRHSRNLKNVRSAGNSYGGGLI